MVAKRTAVEPEKRTPEPKEKAPVDLLAEHVRAVCDIRPDLSPPTGPLPVFKAL